MADIDALYQAALAAHQANHFREAAQRYQQVLGLDPKHADALQGLGLIHKQAMNYDVARELLERAVRSAPSRPDILSNYAAVLRDLELFDESVNVFEHAVKLAPNHPMINVNMALALHQHGDKQKAAQYCEHAIQCDPQCAPAYLALGDALLEIDPQQSQQAFTKALEIQPELHKAQEKLVIVLIANNQAQKGLEKAQQWLTNHPGDIDAIAQIATALHALGRHVEAQQLVDFENLLISHETLVPEGYNSIEDFNDALYQHVLQHPKLTRCVQKHATTNGLRVDNILTPPKGPVELLEQAIYRGANQYIERIQTILPSNHPLLQIHVKKNVWRPHAWGVLLESQGYETPHYHPSGKLSGVYYAHIPEAISDQADDDTAGHIEFGTPDPAYKQESGFDVVSIKPIAGTMLFFPSYFWHRTIPFTSEEQRLSIAFDLGIGAA